MARTDQYKTNISGTISPYHIIINDDIGLDIYHQSPIIGKFGPAEQNQNNNIREKSVIIDNLVNGMGMSHRDIPNTYAFAINGYARSPRKFMPGGQLTEISLAGLGWTTDQLSGEIRCANEWGGDIYVGAGQFILKFTAGLGNPSQDYNMGNNNQIDSAITYNNIPLFSTDQTFSTWQYLTAYDTGLGHWKTAHKTGDPASSADHPVNYTHPVYLEKMKTVFQEVDGIGGNRLIGNDSLLTYTQVQTTNIDTMIGDTTAYGASLACGDTSYRIQNIFETAHIFAIGKADGVYGIESSGIYCPNYVPDMKKNPSLLNNLWGEYFAGKLFVGTYQGLLMVDIASQERQDVPLYVSPSYYYSNETPIFGVPTAGCPDNGWLAVWLWNGTDSHLCYLRPKEDTAASQTPNPVIWHGSECTIENMRVTLAFKTSISGAPRMLIGGHDGTRMHLYWLSLPVEGDPYTDFLSGGSHTFSPTCKLYIPFQDWDDANAKKIVRRYDLKTEGLSIPLLDSDTGEQTGTENRGVLTIFANSDSGSRIFFENVEPTAPNSEWKIQGIASDSIQGKTTLIPSSGGAEGDEIGILLIGDLTDLSDNPGITSSIYKPFVIKSIKIRAEVLIEQLEEKTYKVILGYLSSTTSGGRDFEQIQTKLNKLISLQDSGPVNFLDELGTISVAKLEPGLTYELIPERAGQPWTYVVTFTMAFIGRPFFYDIGENFDGIYIWG